MVEYLIGFASGTPQLKKGLKEHLFSQAYLPVRTV